MKLKENISRLIIIYVEFIPAGKEESLNETNIGIVILQGKGYNKHLKFLFEYAVEMIIVKFIFL